MLEVALKCAAKPAVSDPSTSHTDCGPSMSTFRKRKASDLGTKTVQNLRCTTASSGLSDFQLSLFNQYFGKFMAFQDPLPRFFKIQSEVYFNRLHLNF